MEQNNWQTKDKCLNFSFYSYKDPESGTVWINGKSIATSLGFKDPSASLNRKVDIVQRKKWREVHKKQNDVILPDGWHPDTVMINQKGLRQLMGPEHLYWTEIEQLWCEKFNTEKLSEITEESEECDFLEFQSWKLDNLVLEFGSYTDPKNGEVWVVAKHIAKTLGYSDYNHTHSRILPAFRCTMRELMTHDIDLSRVSETPGKSTSLILPQLNDAQSRLVMINEGGVQQLILESKLPNVIRYKQWVCGTVLPSIRKSGQYIKNNDNSMVELLKNKLALAELKVTNAELQTNNTVAITEERIARIQAERVREQAQFELLRFQLLLGMGKQGLLSTDLKQDIQNLASNLKNRVIPTPIPAKQSCISVYARRNEKGVLILRVCRHQTSTADRVDVLSKTIDITKKKNSKEKKQYTWLFGAENVLRLPCSNGVDIWLACKRMHPHFFYGVHFLNPHQTDFRVLSRNELVERYNKDIKSGHNVLGFRSVDDMVNHCLTSSSDLIQKVTGAIKRASDTINDTLVIKRDITDYSDPQAVDFAINYFNITSNGAIAQNALPLSISTNPQ